MTKLSDLDDVELIRTRPGMFVGGTDRTGMHVLIWEVLANAIDEFLAGRCSRIDLTLHSDGSVSVTDDGPGILVECDEQGTSWLEQVLTTIHDTATADGHAPHVHLSPFHTGLCLVSALSSSLSVEVRRDGQTWRIELEAGRVSRPLISTGAAATTGTTVRFKPDATIFEETELDVETIARRLRELSCLLPGLTTSFSCEPRPYGDMGLVDLIRPPHGTRQHRKPVIGEARSGPSIARVAMEWRNWPGEPSVVAYCNLDLIPKGAHIEGFERGLAEAFGRHDYRKVFDAISRGLHAVINVLVIDPEYRGPIREKIASKEARAVVQEATARALERALVSDHALRERLLAALKRS